MSERGQHSTDDSPRYFWAARKTGTLFLTRTNGETKDCTMYIARRPPAPPDPLNRRVPPSRDLIIDNEGEKKTLGKVMFFYFLI